MKTHEHTHRGRRNPSGPALILKQFFRNSHHHRRRETNAGGFVFKWICSVAAAAGCTSTNRSALSPAMTAYLRTCTSICVRTLEDPFLGKARTFRSVLTSWRNPQWCVHTERSVNIRRGLYKVNKKDAIFSVSRHKWRNAKLASLTRIVIYELKRDIHCPAGKRNPEIRFDSMGMLINYCYIFNF